MTALSISNVVLWVIQMFTIVVVFGLARQIGVLHQRVRPLGPGKVQDGPALGSRVSQQILTSAGGNDIPLVHDKGVSLLALVSPHCSACKPLIESAHSLRKAQPEVRILVAVDGTESERANYLADYSFDHIVDSNQITAVSVASRPFALALGPDGTVLQAGVPNTLEQLEILLSTARQMTTMSEPATQGVAVASGLGARAPLGPGDRLLLETAPRTSVKTREEP